MKQTIGKPEALYDKFDRKPGADKETTHYCPGCGHGNIHKFIAEALDELGVRERAIFISPVGCSVFGYYYFRCGNIQAAHGRAPAVATAVKRAHPNAIVICYQGDGDLASIGGNNILQAANRGENFTVVFVNNAIYGMTGGQMAPTTLLGQKTSTSPYGREFERAGNPLRVAELLSGLDAPSYIERCHLDESKHVLKARASIRKAIKAQIDGKGFSLVEIVSPCPTGWGLDPIKSREWIKEAMAPIFPAGVKCDRRKEIHRKELPPPTFDRAEIRQALKLDEELKTVGKQPELKKTHRFVVAGFGGQGILMLGVLMARMGMAQGHHVSWLPSYGPEMRGGTANCNVVISKERIGSPMVSIPSIAVAFNQPSLEKFGPLVEPGGHVIYDSSFVADPWDRADVEVHRIPFSQMANEIGSAKVANMVALGAINAVFDLYPPELVEAMIRGMGKDKFIDVNLRAFKAGTAAVGKVTA
jgi:2-oxoisovalerate ferredoxin oxidoreductase beta subunit